MRAFNKREKEIIKQLVEYDFENLNTLSRFLQDKYFTEEDGIAFVIAPKDKLSFFFYCPTKYNQGNERLKCGYVIEMAHLFIYLFESRYLTRYRGEQLSLLLLSSRANRDPYFDKRNKSLFVNDKKEYIDFTSNEWLASDKSTIYKSVKFDNNIIDFNELFNTAVFVSEDLKELVKNNFQSVEQLRFKTQMENAESKHQEAMRKAGDQIKIGWGAFVIASLTAVASVVIPFCSSTKLAEIDEIKGAIKAAKTETSTVISPTITNDTIKVDVVNKIDRVETRK